MSATGLKERDWGGEKKRIQQWLQTSVEILLKANSIGGNIWTRFTQNLFSYSSTLQEISLFPFWFHKVYSSVEVVWFQKDVQQTTSKKTVTTNPGE